jgi:hypothetical protein
MIGEGICKGYKKIIVEIVYDPSTTKTGRITVPDIVECLTTGAYYSDTRSLKIKKINQPQDDRRSIQRKINNN